MNSGRKFAADVYGRNVVKPNIGNCKKDTFTWYPVRIVGAQKEITTVISKIIRFNKGGIMVRA